MTPLRQLSGDPTATVTSQQCTTDKNWLVAAGQFKAGGNPTPAAWLILQRRNHRWQQVAHLDHGGDCVVMVQQGAPIREIDDLVKNFLPLRADRGRSDPGTTPGERPVVWSGC